MLASVPALQRVDDAYGPVDRWRFTAHGCETLFKGAGFSSVEAEARGNVVAPFGFLLGLAAEEFAPTRLATNDDDYAVIGLVRAVK